jgi:hypothetical protein
MKKWILGLRHHSRAAPARAEPPVAPEKTGDFMLWHRARTAEPWIAARGDLPQNRPGMGDPDPQNPNRSCAPYLRHCDAESKWIRAALRTAGA